VSDLTLERREQAPGGHVAPGIAMTPALDEDYWSYRVRLTDDQAVLGFPKFWTIGIGFEREEDWNTNLPYTSDAGEIFEHIKHNKGDDAITDEDVLEAIRLIQAAATEDRDEVEP
jgi:hypothetical protein